VIEIDPVSGQTDRCPSRPENRRRSRDVFSFQVSRVMDGSKGKKHRPTNPVALRRAVKWYIAADGTRSLRDAVLRR
jgi:hypothetical protein